MRGSIVPKARGFGGIAEIVPGTLHAPPESYQTESDESVWGLVDTPAIEVAKGLDLAVSDDPAALWEPFRGFVEEMISVEVFGYTVRAFIMSHERCAAGMQEGMAAAMRKARYWVFNRAAPTYSPPSIALSSEIPPKFRSLPVLHEAFENAVTLGGVTVGGVRAPDAGKCALASKVEIAHALNMMSHPDVAEYLRQREHMLSNLGSSAEFDGSLALIRAVLPRLCS